MQNTMSTYIGVAKTIVSLFPPEQLTWHYETGFLLQALLEVDAVQGSDEFFPYILSVTEYLVDKEGNIRGYDLEEYNSDQVNTGKVLFDVYKRTGDHRYYKALQVLRSQFYTHPQTQSGAFWHKKIYPHQVWLDGLYMRGPFLVRFGKEFNEPDLYNMVCREFVLVEDRCKDPRTGLLYHAWDESRSQLWSNPETGCSPHFWGRAMGWFLMALVDILELLPEDHSCRKPLTEILRRTLDAVLAVQDPRTGIWYQILDSQDRKGNYTETSASAMFVYALAKGVRLSLVPVSLLPAAEKAYAGLLREKIIRDSEGRIHVKDICKVAGLGGNPYRNGSFAYYIGEPRVMDDPKGVSAFLLASVEMEGRLSWKHRS